MKIVVVGAGALGSLFGGLLTKGGEEVWLYDPIAKEHIAKISTEGLVIEEEDEEQWIMVRGTTEIEEIGQAELVALFVKAPYTEKAITGALPAVSPTTWVLSLQNGLGITEILGKYVRQSRLLRGVTAQGSTFLAPGRIRHAGRGPTYIGRLSDEDGEGRVQEIVAAFNHAGIETHTERDIKKLVWRKLLINVGINALTALFNVPNGELINNPGLRAIMQGVIQEAVTVAQAEGLNFQPDRTIQEVEEVCRLTGKNISSMLQDIRRGNRTEIDYINGAIVREGERLGVKVPINRLLTELIKNQEGSR